MTKETLTRDTFLKYLDYKQKDFVWGAPLHLKGTLANNVLLDSLRDINFINSRFKNCTLQKASFNKSVLERCELTFPYLSRCSGTHFSNCTLRGIDCAFFTKNTFENCVVEKAHGDLVLNSCHVINTDFISCYIDELSIKQTKFINSFFKSCEFAVKPRTKQKIFIGCDFPSRPSSSKPYTKGDIQK